MLYYNNYMSNPFKYTLDNKRYHTYNYHLKTKYLRKVAKVALDANFTCPNIDGSKAFGGCTFCNETGSSDYSSPYIGNVLEQYYSYKNNYIDKKWPNAYTIAYFQAYTNTYGPLEKIKKMLEPFLQLDEVKEISLATRVDCLDDDCIAYLNSLTSIKEIYLEFGIQSSNNKTLKSINRAHTFEDYLNIMEKIEKTNLKVCLHIINGFPKEDEEMMLKTIKDISKRKFHAIKFHMLEVLEGSNLALQYKYKPFKLLEMNEYIDIVIKQLELLDPLVVVERICSDYSASGLIAPLWVKNKTMIRNELDKRMLALNTYQGRLYEH